jgi:hypothetical protein
MFGKQPPGHSPVTSASKDKETFLIPSETINFAPDASSSPHPKQNSKASRSLLHFTVKLTAAFFLIQSISYL